LKKFSFLDLLLGCSVIHRHKKKQMTNNSSTSIANHDRHQPVKLPVQANGDFPFGTGKGNKLKSANVTVGNEVVEMALLSTEGSGFNPVDVFMTHLVIPKGFHSLILDENLQIGGRLSGAPDIPFKCILLWDKDLTGELDHNCCDEMNSFLINVAPQGCIPILRTTDGLMVFEYEEGSSNTLDVLKFDAPSNATTAKITAEIVKCQIFILGLLPGLSLTYVGFENKAAAQAFLIKHYGTGSGNQNKWIEIGSPLWMEKKECFVAAYEPGG